MLDHLSARYVVQTAVGATVCGPSYVCNFLYHDYWRLLGKLLLSSGQVSRTSCESHAFAVNSRLCSL